MYTGGDISDTESGVALASLSCLAVRANERQFDDRFDRSADDGRKTVDSRKTRGYDGR